MFGNALMFSVFCAGVQISQGGQNSGADGLNPQQTIAAGLGQQLGELGEELARRKARIQPTLEIRPGLPLHGDGHQGHAAPPMAEAVSSQTSDVINALPFAERLIGSRIIIQGASGAGKTYRSARSSDHPRPDAAPGSRCRG